MSITLAFDVVHLVDTYLKAHYGASVVWGDVSLSDEVIILEGCEVTEDVDEVVLAMHEIVLEENR